MLQELTVWRPTKQNIQKFSLFSFEIYKMARERGGRVGERERGRGGRGEKEERFTLALEQ